MVSFPASTEGLDAPSYFFGGLAGVFSDRSCWWYALGAFRVPSVHSLSELILF